MAKLNQLIAVLPKLKKDATEAKSEAHHKMMVKDLLMGLSRTYQPKLDGGDQYPGETKLVQYTVGRGIKDYSEATIEVCDAVLAQELSNQQAKANIVVDGTTLVEDAPIGYILFLEKQIEDTITLAKELPTLDTATEWDYDSVSDHYKSKPVQTLKTTKQPFNHEKAPATKEHPAQVEIFHRDVVEGTYTKVEFSGAIPAKRKNAMLQRARALLLAVKKAKEEANMMDIVERKVGKTILDYVFEG